MCFGGFVDVVGLCDVELWEYGGVYVLEGFDELVDQVVVDGVEEVGVECFVFVEEVFVVVGFVDYFGDEVVEFWVCLSLSGFDYVFCYGEVEGEMYFYDFVQGLQ